LTAGEDPRAPYVSYAQMDALHALAQPRTDSPLELSFILLSHVKELLFRMVYVELDQARSRLRADEAGAACRALERAARSQRVLVASWEAMNGMSVDEFLVFRDILGEASGTQSFMYRTLEFAMGNKDPRAVRQAEAQLPLYPGLKDELHGPSVYDEALAFLSRRGLPIPEQVLNRDLTRQYTFDPAVENAWAQVYRQPAGQPEAYRLAECLIELAYQFSHWRSTHLLVVERMLGGKTGTAGTDGAAWLRTVNEHRFFPELWSLRTVL
jgi:tryptophan 2,3-dioxygenase